MATYLIDYENVSKDGLNGVTRLTEKDRVIIFYSERADRMTFGLHRRLNETKATVEYKKVDVGGHNALDFQLATYLGFLVAKDSSEEYCVVSNDRGFEYLTGFWRKPLYDVTLTRTISESPQAEERRQARRNSQNGNGRNGNDSRNDQDPNRQEDRTAQSEVLPEQEALSEEAGREPQTAAGAAMNPDLSEADGAEPENLAVITVAEKPLVVVPGAEERQLDILRDHPLQMELNMDGTQTAQDVADGPDNARTAQDPSENAAASDDAAAGQSSENDSVEPALEKAKDESAEAKKPSRKSRRSRRGSRSKAQKSEQQDDRKEEAESAGPNPSAGADESAEITGSADQDGAGEKPENDDVKAEAKSKAASSKRRRASRSRKRVTIPYLADVKSLVGGSGLSDKELQEVAGFVERYKTKQGVNNALVRKFGNQKGGELYQVIKPLLKDKKGHVTQKTQKESAEDKK